jgi:RimJ/RimL family protein N-acetyltransferase
LDVIRVLVGKAIRLSILEESHLDRIMLDWNNPEMRKYLAGYMPNSREYEAQWIENAQQQMRDRKSFYFALERIEDDEFLGTLGIHDIDWLSRSARIGITIHGPSNWGQGYGTEAMKILIGFAWEDLNLRRLELSVHAFNKRATRVYEKLGFVAFGTAHGRHFIDGEYVDTILMELFRAPQ